MKLEKARELIICYFIDIFTLRISGLMGFGPLPEKETTVGAITSLSVSVERIVAVGVLQRNVLFIIVPKISSCVLHILES